MICNKILLVFLCVAVFLSAYSQNVAIVKNMNNAEIDSLKSYLEEMSFTVTVFPQSPINTDSLTGFDLVIWDDLSYASGGLTDYEVFLFDSVRQRGQKLYFIGDDLPFSANYTLSPAADTVWWNLIHLTAVGNLSSASTIMISDSTHPIINGPYGKVTDFPAYIDPDAAYATNTGEKVIAITDNNFDVIIGFEDSSGFRSVTQNVLAFNPGAPLASIKTKMLFKNAVSWLIYEPSSIINKNDSFVHNFVLKQNYPNPFNPSTIIEFSIPKADFVTLKIYNLLGKEVVTLVSDKLAPDNYKFVWDASEVASGIYFYKLQTGEYVEIKKMVLLQ